MEAAFDLARVPPQSTEAEQATLGSMLLDRDAIIKAIDMLSPEDFYRDTHRIIFDTIISMYEKGKPIDLVTVTEELRQRDALDLIGGIPYITSLASIVPTAANIDYYARIMKEKAIYRALVKVGTNIAALGYEGTEDVDLALDQSEQMIFSLSQQKGSDGVADIKMVLMDTFESIERLYETKGRGTGVPTGFKDLDVMLTGLQPSDLIIIAARPSMGKTSLALNIASHVALNENLPVIVFSLEMSREQLAMRLLSSEARVDGQRLRRGELADEDWQKLSYGLGRLSEAPLYIDDSPTLTALDIRARSRRLKAEIGLGLIVIDYLQLIQGRARSENRQQEIAEITRSLKSLARELKVPVVALAQLSRAVETAAERRPLLSHLKESGEIETAADVVAFIYREDYYSQDTKKKNMAEIIVAKQRNGPTGSVELLWRKEFTRFESLERYQKPG
ncbi:MAG: replicative DNA helicase [Firmicutes bacterium]|mgnify:CR=1 FL=1|jgi:replicative DNA helicase|nr:replicative DNA helicase [Bacillota bacterium]